MFRSPNTVLVTPVWKSAAVLCLFLCAWPSFGVLGEDVSSVQADQMHIRARVRITPGEKYTVHELQSTSGAVVREYASPSGLVFAVAWRGPMLPDMKQLLGSHFEEFRQAAQTQTRHGVHAPLFVQLPDLVVELGGHMRSFVGRAYLPDQLPANVRAEEIR
jgi:Protein of unknown function (DUF2844)